MGVADLMGLAERGVESFDDAVAVGGFGDVAVAGGDEFADGGDGVGGAGGEAGVLGGEHFDVVVAVSGGEDVGDGDLEEVSDFGQSTTFLVVLVTEAEVDRVALPAEQGDFLDEGFDLGDDPFHFLLGAGDDACGVAVDFDVLGAGVFLDEGLDVFEDFVCFFEEGVDVFFAAFVPWFVGEEAAEVVREVDFAFAGDDPVREEGEAGFDETFDDLRHGASGVDAPDGVALFAEGADGGEEIAGDGWVFGRIVECAIEVEGEEDLRSWAGVKCSHVGEITERKREGESFLVNCFNRAVADDLASNPWIAEMLEMGHTGVLSCLKGGSGKDKIEMRA